MKQFETPRGFVFKDIEDDFFPEIKVYHYLELQGGGIATNKRVGLYIIRDYRHYKLSKINKK